MGGLTDIIPNEEILVCVDSSIPAHPHTMGHGASGSSIQIVQYGDTITIDDLAGTIITPHHGKTPFPAIYSQELLFCPIIMMGFLIYVKVIWIIIKSQVLAFLYYCPTLF